MISCYNWVCFIIPKVKWDMVWMKDCCFLTEVERVSSVWVSQTLLFMFILSSSFLSHQITEAQLHGVTAGCQLSAPSSYTRADQTWLDAPVPDTQSHQVERGILIRIWIYSILGSDQYILRLKANFKATITLLRSLDTGEAQIGHITGDKPRETMPLTTKIMSREKLNESRRLSEERLCGFKVCWYKQRSYFISETKMASDSRLSWRKLANFYWTQKVESSVYVSC